MSDRSNESSFPMPGDLPKNIKPRPFVDPNTHPLPPHLACRLNAQANANASSNASGIPTNVNISDVKSLIRQRTLTLSHEIWKHIVSNDLTQFDVHIENVLTQLAQRGLSSPHEFLSAIVSEMAHVYQQFDTLDHINDSEQSNNASTRLAALACAHRVVVNSWNEQIDRDNIGWLVAQ